MKIIIGADLVPTDSNIELFCQGAKQELFGNELADLLDRASFRIFNLEVPLADSDTPILKQGPNFRAPTKCAKGLRAIGVDLLTLANNHILDQGEQGLRSTIQALDDVGIGYVGAGMNLQKAEEPFFFEISGKRYGIYACAEHEFSIAGEDSPGANPFDPLDTPDRIMKVKSGCDYLVVLYHGGKEHYRYPSPNLQKSCRKLVEKGANLVVCQHSHCIGCKEEYQNGTIIYGQGNFLFDQANTECWNTGLLLSISEDGTVGYIPLMKRDRGVRLADRDEKERILSEFKKRSDEILQEGFIQQQYQEYAAKAIDDYMLFLTGKRESFVFRIANRLSGYWLQKHVVQKYCRKVRIGLRNYVECEAHRELLIRGLELKSNEIGKPGCANKDYK